MRDGVRCYEISKFDAENLLARMLDQPAEVEKVEEVLSRVHISERDEPKTSPFFELPGELRNSIYECLFQYPRSGVLVAGPDTPKPGDRPSRRSWPLLVLNRSLDETFHRTSGKTSSVANLR